MEMHQRIERQRELIAQVRLAAEERGWVPKGNLSIYTVEQLTEMSAQIEIGIKPRAFKDPRRGPKPGWQDRPATVTQRIKIYEGIQRTGVTIPIEDLKTLTRGQAQAVIQKLWDIYWDMEEEREGFDVGSTG